MNYLTTDTHSLSTDKHVTVCLQQEWDGMERPGWKTYDGDEQRQSESSWELSCLCGWCSGMFSWKQAIKIISILFGTLCNYKELLLILEEERRDITRWWFLTCWRSAFMLVLWVFIFTLLIALSVGFRAVDWFGYFRIFHFFALKKSWVVYTVHLISLSICPFKQIQ